MHEKGFNEHRRDSVLSPSQLTNILSFRRKSVPSSATQKESGENRSASIAEPLPGPSRRKSSLVGLPLVGKRNKPKPKEPVETEKDVVKADLPQTKLFTLPNELLLQIAFELTTDLKDILNLRLVSRSIHNLINSNSLPITKALVRKHNFQISLQLWETLYPLPQHNGSLQYIFQTCQRHQSVLRACSVVGDFIQFEIYRSRSSQFSAKRRRIEERLQTSVLIIEHFLFSLKSQLSLKTCGSSALDSILSTQISLLSSYRPSSLPAAFQTSKILFSIFRQKLRAPTYAGSMERTLRGWNHPAATDLELSRIAIYGGLGAMLSVMAPLKYASRLEAAQCFVEGVCEHHVCGRARAARHDDEEESSRCLLDCLPVGKELFIAPTRAKILNDKIAGDEEELPGSLDWVDHLVNDDAW
ncbi:MAG: hypothetical protein Q9227_004739 [Pyrenula ochraceoflavens]